MEESKILLGDFIPVNQRPDIQVDSNIKRDFSTKKLIAAEKRALDLVDDLPNSRTGIKTLVEGYFSGDEFKEEMTFGLGIYGKKRQITLSVSFVEEKPVFRLTSVSRPDFGLNSKTSVVE